MNFDDSLVNVVTHINIQTKVMKVLRSASLLQVIVILQPIKLQYYYSSTTVLFTF